MTGPAQGRLGNDIQKFFFFLAKVWIVSAMGGQVLRRHCPSNHTKAGRLWFCFITGWWKLLCMGVDSVAYGCVFVVYWSWYLKDLLYLLLYKSCCQQYGAYHIHDLLWVSLVCDLCLVWAKNMITWQWSLMISCWNVSNCFLLFIYSFASLENVVNRVGYSNGILQIDGGSSSANGAKTSSGSSQILRVSPQTLVYLELSPDFCRTNATAGGFH